MLDAALEAVAVRQALVALAPQVPRLVAEHGDRARRSRERLHPVLDRELVERVADRRRQVRLAAADLREAVRVLDEADVVAALVARDRGRMARDRARLAGEDRLGLRLVRSARPRSSRSDGRRSREGCPTIAIAATASTTWSQLKVGSAAIGGVGSDGSQ